MYNCSTNFLKMRNNLIQRKVLTINYRKKNRFNSLIILTVKRKKKKKVQKKTDKIPPRTYLINEKTLYRDHTIKCKRKKGTIAV